MPPKPALVQELLRIPQGQTTGVVLPPPYVLARIQARVTEEEPGGRSQAELLTKMRQYVREVIADVWDEFSKVLSRSYGDAVALYEDLLKPPSMRPVERLDQAVGGLKTLLGVVREQASFRGRDLEIGKAPPPVGDPPGKARWRMTVYGGGRLVYAFVPAGMSDDDYRRFGAPKPQQFPADITWGEAESRVAEQLEVYQRSEAERHQALLELLQFRREVYERVLEHYRLYGRTVRYVDLQPVDQLVQFGGLYDDVRLRFGAIRDVLKVYEDAKKHFRSVAAVYKAAAQTDALKGFYNGYEPENSLASFVNDVMSDLGLHEWRQKQWRGSRRVTLLRAVVEAWLAVDEGEGRDKLSAYRSGVRAKVAALTPP